jgi:hypothetical protein
MGGDEAGVGVEYNTSCCFDREGQL